MTTKNQSSIVPDFQQYSFIVPDLPSSIVPNLQQYSFIVWSDDDIARDNYQQWQNKRNEDTKYCGCYHGYINLLNGKVRYLARACNEPHCKRCGPRIRECMKKNLVAKLEKTPLSKITLTGTIEEQKIKRAKILREFGKNKVMVSVNDDHENVLSCSTDIIIDGTISNKVSSWLDNDDTQKIITSISDNDIEKWSTKSPYGKSAGALHKQQIVAPKEKKEDQKENKENEEKLETINHVASFETNTEDIKTLNEVEHEVQKQTSQFNPKTVQELTQALKRRHELRERLLIEKGIVILSNKYIKKQVKMNDVIWIVEKKPIRTIKFKYTEDEIPF